MADPTAYEPDYSFSNYQASNPSRPLPGDRVDTEFANAATASAEAVAAIMDVRRSDGALHNGIVTIDSLSPEVAAGIGTGSLDAQEAAEAAAAAAEASADDASASAALAAASVASLAGTSATSNVLGLGAKSFVTQANKYFSPGTPVTISSAANPSVDYMSGVVSTYVGTALGLTITAFSGTGTHTDWAIVVSGVQGPAGAAGSAGAGTGDMLKANNLSDLTSAATARGNLGLGSLAVLNTVPNNGITTVMITDANVTTAKIADANVTTVKIADDNVTTAKILDANITTAKILDANVTTAKIADANITNAKLATVAANTVKANATAGTASPTDVSVAASQLVGRGSTGNIAAIALGSGLSMSGTTLNSSAPTFFESSEQTASIGTLVSVAHSLGGVPKGFSAVLRCKTADITYSVGDEVECVPNYDGANQAGCLAGANATNVFVRTQSTIKLYSPTTGTLTAITPSRWRLVFRAFI